MSIYNGRIHGTVISLLEYFLFLRKLNINIYLIIITEKNNRSNILSQYDALINDRYNIDFNWKQNIIWSDSNIGLIRYKFNHLLSTYHIYDTSRLFLVANQYHLIHDYNSQYITEFKYNDKIIHYNEREDICADISYIKYTKKIWLDGLKSFNSCDSSYLINMTACNKSINEEMFINHILPIIKNNKLIIVGKIYNMSEPSFFYKYPNIIRLKEHPKNFFSLFDKYIYFSIEDNDYSPRLIIECKYLNKKIIPLQLKESKDGFNYRYDDVLNNNIEKYKLNKTDEIIQQFL